ncbi:MAG: hypothetical protein AB1607_13495 [Chloroflexota bacterium]
MLSRQITGMRDDAIPHHVTQFHQNWKELLGGKEKMSKEQNLKELGF